LPLERWAFTMSFTLKFLSVRRLFVPKVTLMEMNLGDMLRGIENFWWFSIETTRKGNNVT